MVDSNNEWRFSSIGYCQVEAGVVEGDEKTYNSDSSDIKEQNTDVDTFDCLGKVASGVFGLTSGDLKTD